MRGSEMEGLINAALAPVFGHRIYYCKYSEQSGTPRFVVRYGSTRSTSTDIATLASSDVWLMLELQSVPKHPWRPGADMPEKIRVIQDHGSTDDLFSPRTGTPVQVVTYIIKFFTEHREELLHPAGRR